MKRGGLGVLLMLSGCGQTAQSPPLSAPALAHQVAQTELARAQAVMANHEGNHPEMFVVDVMQGIPLATVAPTAKGPAEHLTPDQAALLRDVEARLSAARHGYDALFNEQSLGLASWDPAPIVRAARESASDQQPPDHAAALVLEEIGNAQLLRDLSKGPPSPTEQ